MQSESEHKAEEVTGMHPFAFRFTFQLNHKVEGIESLYCFPHLQSGRISVHPIFSLQHQHSEAEYFLCIMLLCPADGRIE